MGGEQKLLRLLSSSPVFLVSFLLILCSHHLPTIFSREIFLPSEGRHADFLRTYIVHVRPPPFPWASNTTDEGREGWYRSFLPLQTADSGEPRLLYAYHYVVSGFAARLTEQELAALREVDGFLAAYPVKLLQLHTTHTPAFLGLDPPETGLWNSSNFGEGMIIGLLDTGINPNHPSFRCSMPSPPPKWKGQCDFEPEECNNKIIGARAFTVGLEAMMQGEAAGNIIIRSMVRADKRPYDTAGHGTHTASTAAGCFVPNASSYENAEGTAAGMAPSAHLAIYRVCTAFYCDESDILAALDAAIHDGVDVVSMSLGGVSQPFYSDNIHIGTFAVTENGIFVSCSAGNRGPSPQTLSNEAPWLLTVGASSIDRSIRATVSLGNGAAFNGESIYQPANFTPTLLPLVYTGNCSQDSLSSGDVTGKVVVCDASPFGESGDIEEGANVRDAGGAAMVLAATADQGYTIPAEPHVLPASRVSFVDGTDIKAYARSNPSPTAAIIFKGTVIGDESPISPAVAFFSSRGPNKASPGILKPDIVGPGLNIIAAWYEPVGPAGGATSKFNIISGTSMAAPHLSGIAALLKKMHPSWSPAVIKSAMMTTGTVFNRRGTRIQDETGNPASYFAMGSGHVSPARAASPGLVYDIDPADYLRYLCGLNYTDDQVSTIARRPVKCSATEMVPEDQLNYPSFRIVLTAAKNFSRTVVRTVTNVGDADNSCSVTVDAPPGVSVAVTPTVMAFTAVNQQKSFLVGFSTTAATGAAPPETSGSLTWVCSGDTLVTSPLVVSLE